MDVSSEYIKMCYEAKEIQDHQASAGDFYYNESLEEIVILPLEKHIKGFCSYECLYLVGIEDYWWLPRQDQLQEIIRNLKNVSDYGLVHRMNHFVYGEDGESDFTEEAQKCHSMEQLWISFVMKENGKTWDGEKWVEI